MGDLVVSVREEQCRSSLEDLGHLVDLGQDQGSRAAVLLPCSSGCTRAPGRSLIPMWGNSGNEAPGPVAEADKPARVS
jgi:hypothetical protein